MSRKLEITKLAKNRDEVSIAKIIGNSLKGDLECEVKVKGRKISIKLYSDDGIVDRKYGEVVVNQLKIARIKGIHDVKVYAKGETHSWKISKRIRASFLEKVGYSISALIGIGWLLGVLFPSKNQVAYEACIDRMMASGQTGSVSRGVAEYSCEKRLTDDDLADAELRRR